VLGNDDPAGGSCRWRADGKAWTKLVSAAAQQHASQQPGCGGIQPLHNLPTTTLAAALEAQDSSPFKGTRVRDGDIAGGRDRFPA
jgi:hypothetical protein